AEAEAPDTTTTRIDVGQHLDVGRRALLAHRTQVAPNGFFFRVPLEAMREIHPWEDYELARSLVDVRVVDGEYEHDLFEGVRVTTRSSPGAWGEPNATTPRSEARSARPSARRGGGGAGTRRP